MGLDKRLEGSPMIEQFEFFSPTTIFQKEKSTVHLIRELASHRVYRPLLLTDGSIKRKRLLRRLDTAVKRHHSGNGFDYSGPVELPSREAALDVIHEIAAVYREKRCDGIVAAGGGQLLKTVKAVRVLVSSDCENVAQCIDHEVLSHRLVPLLVIATSIETCTEISPMVVVRDRTAGKKIVISSRYLLPDALFNETWSMNSLSLQRNISASMEAFTRALESYLCGYDNPMAGSFGTAALKLLSENLPLAVKKSKDRKCWKPIIFASALAGIAQTNTMIGLTFILGHSINSLCLVPPGTAMSILLPHVLEYGIEKRTIYSEKAIGEVLRYLVGQHGYDSFVETERSKKVIDFFRTLKEQFFQTAGVPRTLQETGKVSIDHLQDIALLAVGDAALLRNPVSVEKKAALDILTKAYSGPMVVP